MAIDTETRRESAFNAGGFFPGKVPLFSEPDGSDLDTANQRGIPVWQYAGISASAVVAADQGQTSLGHLSGILKRKRLLGRTFN